jgi:hypothetical protein
MMHFMPNNARRGALFLLLLLTACSARTLTKKSARDIILSLDTGTLEKEGVYIESVSQTGQRDALAEATLRAAFRFEKVKDKWVIREVRLGKGEWQKLDHILRALEQVKTDETRKLLDQVATAIEKYWEKNGGLPEFKDFVSLSDLLNPNFMSSLIREDSWHHPLAAYMNGPSAVRLVSPGPDGQLGTGDDIELVKTFPHK